MALNNLQPLICHKTKPNQHICTFMNINTYRWLCTYLRVCVCVCVYVCVAHAYLMDIDNSKCIECIVFYCIFRCVLFPITPSLSMSVCLSFSFSRKSLDVTDNRAISIYNWLPCNRTEKGNKKKKKKKQIQKRKEKHITRRHFNCYWLNKTTTQANSKRKLRICRWTKYQ